MLLTQYILCNVIAKVMTLGIMFFYIERKTLNSYFIFNKT